MRPAANQKGGAALARLADRRVPFRESQLALRPNWARLAPLDHFGRCESCRRIRTVVVVRPGGRASSGGAREDLARPAGQTAAGCHCLGGEPSLKSSVGAPASLI